MLANRLKSSIRELIERSPFNQVVNNLYISNRLKFDNPPILIYTSPKTGSSTVELSLQNADLDRPIYKVHYLSPKNLTISAGKYIRENNANPPIINLSKILSQQVTINPNINWKIITLTRDPFSRSISALFQIIERRHPELIDENDKVIINKVNKLLETELASFDNRSNQICRWFNEELKQVFGINIYDYPFDHKAGFTIIRKNRLEVLVMRLEDLDRCFTKGISSLLALDLPPLLVSANLSKHKKFSEDYKRCQQKISFPKTICQNICDSQYVQHFYSQTEREKLIQKYSQF